MKKLIVVIVAVCILNYGLEHIIATYIAHSDVTMQCLVRILQNYVFVIVSIYLINALQLNFKIFKNNKVIIPLCLVFLVWSFLSIEKSIDNSGIHIVFYNHLLFLMSCLFVGAFEELFFRIYVFQKLLNNRKIKSLLIIVVLTSSIYAIVQLPNILKPDSTALSVMVQMVTAFGLGFMFQAIYIKTKNILLPICIHGLVNYFGSYQSLLSEHYFVETLAYDIKGHLVNLSFVLVLALGILKIFDWQRTNKKSI